jgi:hypothetical protein
MGVLLLPQMQISCLFETDYAGWHICALQQFKLGGTMLLYLK